MKRSRLDRFALWTHDGAPETALMDWACDHGLVWLAGTLRCLVHGHEPFTEMDGRTLVCAWCNRRVGETDRQG